MHLKTHLSDPELGGDADLVQFSVFRGDDGAVVVQIDTDEGLGHLRVNINDGPVFDQDPEQPSRLDYAALDRSF